MRVLIVGAGGHAQVVADILLRMQDGGEEILPLGFLDDNPALAGAARLGLPVLGSLRDRHSIEHDAIIIALGDNRVRCSLFRQLSREGEAFATAIHPRAIVAPDVQVGRGSMICAGTVINTGAVIGEDVILNTACSIDHHCRVGDHAHVAPGVHMGGAAIVGPSVLVGIGSTVMPGKRVGELAVVGAGAVVTRDVPDSTVVVGVPARVKKVNCSNA